MITGFNTDVEYNGRIYHVQTEDKGTSNPVIESLIYVGGEILASHRTPYGELLVGGANERSIADRLESQHQRMIRNIRQGKYDPEGVKPFGTGIISDRGFEAVILDYLAAELGSEALQVTVDSPSEFVEGDSVELVLRTRGEISSLPVGGAKVAVRLITTLDKPLTLVEGKTDSRGLLKVPLVIPLLEEGSAALIVQASHGEELAETKSLVKKPGQGA